MASLEHTVRLVLLLAECYCPPADDLEGTVVKLTAQEAAIA